MYYSIYARDQDNSLALRVNARAAHLQRLQDLLQQGRLLVAGPHPAIDGEQPGAAGFSGSLIIAEFASLEAAQAWVNDDLYWTAGVYESIEVKPFQAVLP